MNKYAVQLEMPKGKVEEILEKLTAAQETIRQQFHKPGPSGKDSLRLFPTPKFALAESQRRLKPLEESSCDP